MPLYEYKCSKCGSTFEVLHRVNDTPLKKCYKCGSPVMKVVSPPSLQFKGEGWYVTDYAQKKVPDKENEEKGKEKTKSQKESVPKKSKDSSSGD